MPKLVTVKTKCPYSNQETEFQVFDDNKLILECGCCNLLCEVEKGIATKYEGKLGFSTSTVIYDGSKESTKKLMDLVGFSNGINNTSADGTGLYLHGKFFPIGTEITKIGELCLINGEVFDKTGFLNVKQ